MNLLIVSPFFKPFAGVGANRMDSLVDYLYKKGNYKITVVKNSNESYHKTVKGYLETRNIKIIDVIVSGGFLECSKKYKRAINVLLETSDYQCAIISVGPFFTLPLVNLIKKKSRNKCKVILDIRDFWAHEQITIQKKTSKYYVKDWIKDLFFERPSIRKADCITVTGQDELEVLSKYYGNSIKKKGKAIYNGFDERCLHSLEMVPNKNKTNKKLKLCIFGKFVEYLSSNQREAFIQGLKEDSDIEIIQVGHEEEQLKSALHTEGIEYSNTGYMDYDEGMLFMKKYADVFLVSVDVAIGYGTKIYDYIALNRPIVYFGNKICGLAKFIEKFENSFICDNKWELISAIRTIKKENLLCLDKQNIEKYSREKQNAIFEEMISTL